MVEWYALNNFYQYIKSTMKNETLERKLSDIVRNGKAKSIKVDGKSYYIKNKLIAECKKEGGLLPLAALIPLIASGIGAAGGVAGGAAGIAKAVNDKKAQDAELKEQKRHNREMEKAVGRGYHYVKGEGISNKYSGDGIKDFVRSLGLDKEAKKVIKDFFRNLSEKIQIEPTEGGGLFLSPYMK